MTHIAATTKTSILGIGKPAAKGAGAADGTDFAAVVAGLTDTAAAPTGEEGTALLSDDAGKGSGQDAGTGDGSDATPQQPVVQDLALTAAAQSAVADMVVTPPVQIVPAPVSTETPKATEAVALDTGPTRSRTGWRPATTAPTAPRTPAVQTAAKDAVADPAAQPETASKADGTTPASVTDLLSRIANAMPKRTAQTQTSGAKGSATTTSKVPAAATPAPMAAATAPAASAAPSTATIIPIVRDGAQPATAPEAAPATSETPAPMAIADLLRQRLAPFAQAATAQRDTAAPAATAPAVTTPVMTGAEAPVTATPATATAEVVAEVAAASAPSSTTLVRPVMSALHRAPATAAAEATTAQAAAATPSNGTDAQTGQDSGKKDGSDSPATATTRTAPEDRISLTADNDARPFADIVQTPPPVAQGGVGAVADASSIGATSDVGTGLQNSVIDMSVGGQWIDRVAKEITHLAEGTGHSRFQLSPPHLGRIQIDVWQGEEGAGRVQMLTETDEAARRLRDGQSSLQADARLASLSLGSVTIVHAPGGLDQDGNQDAPRQQNGDQNAFSQQQQSQQGNGQSSSHQQNWGTTGGQLGQNSGQSDGRSGNSAEQGKSSLRRDVLDRDAGTAAQDGGPASGTSDRLVRYA